MKKFTLLFVAAMFSALSFAALNPYAYGLSSSLDADQTELTVNYSLNATATNVDFVLLDGDKVIKTVNLNDKGLDKGSYTATVALDDPNMPLGKKLTWKLEVKGAAHNTTNNHGGYQFYHPSGVDIDNNPESEHFGRILCNEAMQRVENETTKYISAGFGAGIFAFTPAFDPIVNGDKPGFNGGITFPKNRPGKTGTGAAATAYVPRRVRISEDGRIFVTSLNTDGGPYLWEVNADNLDQWTPVFQSSKTSELAEMQDANGNFIAGPNVGFDVRGSGDNLQLLMLSGNTTAWDAAFAAFKCSEYNLGTKTSWKTVPTKIRFENKYVVNYSGSQVQYDQDGGIWLCQNRGTATDAQPALVHWDTNGNEDYKKKLNGLTNAGFRFNNDFTKVIIADAKPYAKIYKVSKDNSGAPVLTLWKTIDMTDMGANLNDFAWDIADNVYAVGNSSEWIRAYALARTADDIATTPCASKYAFVIPAPAQLNPFAYKLSSELSADEKNLTIKYSLNAKATSVNWVLMDGNNVVKTVDLASLGLEKGDYTTTISTTDFPQYKQLTWKIEVKGVAVSEPTEYPVSYDFYHPSSVDIDNNPENLTFGLILCNEAMQSVKGKKQTDTGEDYLSSSLGAGIYAFNPAFDNTGKYNGGNEFTTTRADGTGTAYSPRRIRISDDGRIFVTSLNTDGNYLWEVNPENLNEWTPVFKGTLNSNKELVDASSNFVAAPNVGFDVRGKGADLKLLMLSSNLRGFPSTYAVAAFKCHEYNLGTATTWSATPSKTILSGKYMINYTGDQVAYDAEGGVWFCQHQGTAKEDYPSLVHINKNGVEDYKEVVNNRMAGGIRFNADFTKVIIAGVAEGTKNSKKATVYAVSKDTNGKPVLTQEAVIDMATLGNNLNDFAWDYAGNLYGVSNSSEKIAVWAMPHSSEDAVATPAASKYAFSIGKYTVTVNTNDMNKGTVTGGGEYGAGAVVTLTATPKEGYELLYWSDRSKENPRNITVDGNEALSAYFIKKNDVEPTFSITKVWENTNVPASTNNGYQGAGWDGKIYVKDRENDKIVVYSDATTSGDYAQTDNADDQSIAVDDAGNMVLRSGSGFFYNAPAQIILYKKGETTYKTIDFTLPETGRCDFISASGDLFSAEGGYVYFYCQNKSGVSRLCVKNGGATAADVTVDYVGNITTVGNTQSHVMADIFGNLVTHSRTNAITTTINAHTGETMTFTLPTNHKANALGGCSFELAGKEFWAFNVKGTNTCTSEWNLYNLTDGKFESSAILYVKNQTETNSAANWLNAQVVDEKTAYIYQFCPKVGAAVWKVTRDHIVTATAENGIVAGAGTYKDNATATLTATPNKGYQFKNWTKNGVEVSTENPYSFTVTEDVELVANFDGPFNELILNTNDETKGTVSGAGFYTAGQTATLTATPAAGYKLLYWSDRSTENPRTITMNKDEAISAYFVKEYDMEPTIKIEKVWENTQVPGSADGYQAVGWDGKIYMQNKTAGKIKVYSNGTDAAVDYATSNTSGQQIAVDEAGNLIVFNATFYTITPNAIMIYPKGSTTGTAISFTLPYPERCDFISASGDIYSAEGGYVYFYCQNKNAVNRVKITNGALASVDAIGNTEKPATSVSHVMVDIFGNLAAHCRSTAVYAINSYTGETTAFTTTLSGVKLSTLGGCTFELGGKELWAYNVGTTNYNSEWNLYNMTDKVFMSNETLYAKDKDSRKATGPANWLNVQVVDENTAYIYQFCPEVAVAVWKVTCTTEKTVIIDENVDNTTALESYDGEVVTATVTRSFGSNKYLTLTLPFDMNATQIRNVFGNATVYALYNVVEYNATEVHLQFSPVSTITAGTPYILATATSGYDAEDGFTMEGVEIDLSLKPVTSGTVIMVPVLDAGGTLNQEDEYFLSDNALYCAGTYPRTILGLRAYFKSASPLPIRARVVFQDNAATSIPMVETQPTNQVRKVLKDGQLIIIRGEEMYNMQGQRME